MRELLLNYLPAFVLGFVYIFSTFKFMATFKDKAEEIKQASSYKNLEDQCRILLNQLYEKEFNEKQLKQELETIKDELKTISELYIIKLEEKEKEE